MSRINRMRIGLVVLSALLGCVATATANSSIVLGGNSQIISFTGKGASDPDQLGVSLGACHSGQCRVQGTGFGTGVFPSAHAPFSIISAMGSITATLVNATLGTWSVSESSPIAFSYGAHGSLLTGDLNLLSFQQTSGGKTGVFNWQGVADLTVTGGSLASDFSSAGGVLQVNLLFRNTTSLTSLLGTTKTKYGSFEGGQLSPTPEPSAFVIFVLGSVILLIGGLLRRRKALSPASERATATL